MHEVQIQLVGLTRTYGAGEALVHALAGVDLEIHKGEFLALAGPSGSGKTTLLNLIGCIDTPSAGAILFEGIELGKLDGREQTSFRNHRVGFIFQDFNLVPVLTAYENVELPLQLKGGLRRAEMDAAIRAMLERVGLGALGQRLPRQLSGGQQQRVAIARALVKQPSVLLADEPTANLDSVTAREILELMLELNRTLGTTCVFSTHDPLVMEYARRLVRLRDGRVVDIREVQGATQSAGAGAPSDDRS
jgi:putative ABC transport system ATP-binding protein